jgi:hypothetical protein
MAGALLQLVAYGAQDLYLTGQPQITFFKVVYRRYTNFAMEDIEMQLNGDISLGSRFTVTVTRSGDLLKRVWLEVLLDNPLTTQAFRIGFQLIDYVEVEIGGQVIDKHYGHWMDLWAQLTMSTEEFTKLNDMISGQIEPLAANGAPNPAQRKLYIPLQFWFCNNPGLALPLIALQYHEVKLNVQLKDRIVVTTNTAAGVTQNAFIDVTAANGRIVQSTNIAITRATNTIVGPTTINDTTAWTHNGTFTYLAVAPSIGTDENDASTASTYTVNNNLGNIGAIVVSNAGVITTDLTNIITPLAAIQEGATQITFYRLRRHLNATLAATAVSAGNTLTVTTAEHGLTVGDCVALTDFEPNGGTATDAGATAINSVDDGVVLTVTPTTFTVAVTATAGNYNDGTVSRLDNLITSTPAEIVIQPAIVINSIRVWGEYVFLDTDERRRFAQMSHEYLIEQVQANSAYSTADERSGNIELRFNHPIKTLVVAAQRSQAGTTRHPFDHFYTATATDDCIRTLGLQFNGSDRFKSRDGTYFRTVQLYDTFKGGHLQTRSLDASDNAPLHPCGGFYTYNFALNPGEHQPSGTCNFSRLDSVLLLCTYNTGFTNENTGLVRVYAVNYNILRVVSGMAGVAYSN